MLNKKRVDFMRNISLKKLENPYHKEKNAKAKIRLQCAILRKEGNTLEEIARVTKKPKSTICDILKRFDEKGLIAKDAIKQKGQPKKLSDSQRKQVEKMLGGKPIKKGFPFVIWTTKLVGYAIKKMFGVIYSLRKVTSSIGFLSFSSYKLI